MSTSAGTTFPPPPRAFVPEALDAGDPTRLRPLFEELLSRDLSTPEAVERILSDASELASAVSAEGARRYIAMSRDTADEEANRRHLHFEREVVPLARVLGDQLDRNLLDARGTASLDLDRYGLLLRAKRNLVEIFREENTRLEARDAELRARYAAVTGAMTVRFHGEERTMQQMALFLEERDRRLREEAWRATAARRLAAKGELSSLLDEMLELRGKMAGNAGLPDYVAFRFRELCRFDYTPDDCAAFHAGVEQQVLPAVARLDAGRAGALGLDALRPWDLDVDPEGRPPLRPFTRQEELVELARRLFAAVDPRFASEFSVLETKDLLDLMSRPHKAPGGYQYNLEDVRLPFIFANAAGTHDDVQTLLHEGGHAFHSLLSRHEPLLAYREAPLEFAEVASMGMELMALEHLEEVYGGEAARAARRDHLERVLRLFAWIATVDAFQQWLYTHPGHGAEERREQWLSLRRRFSPTVDFAGLEEEAAHGWQAQGHIFTVPLYYIEYGIAQIGALQLWSNARIDERRAVERYREALRLGGSRPLPELFAAAGLRFGMDRDVLAPLVRAVEEALREGGGGAQA